MVGSERGQALTNGLPDMDRDSEGVAPEHGDPVEVHQETGVRVPGHGGCLATGIKAEHWSIDVT